MCGCGCGCGCGCVGVGVGVCVDSHTTCPWFNITRGLYTLCRAACHALPVYAAWYIHVYMRVCVCVWQHIGQNISAANSHCRNMISDIKATLNPNKLYILRLILIFFYVGKKKIIKHV